MKSYKKLNCDESVYREIKDHLFRRSGGKCEGCLGTTSEARTKGDFDIYVIDDAKPPETNNLVLLDQECRRSILSIVKMLYPEEYAHLKPRYQEREYPDIGQTRDNGVGCGQLNM